MTCYRSASLVLDEAISITSMFQTILSYLLPHPRRLLRLRIAPIFPHFWSQKHSKLSLHEVLLQACLFSFSRPRGTPKKVKASNTTSYKRQMVIIFFKGSTFYRYVVVQFYPWFWTFFPLFSSMLRSQQWLGHKRKKNSTTDKTEPQNIFKGPESETCAILEASPF